MVYCEQTGDISFGRADYIRLTAFQTRRRCEEVNSVQVECLSSKCSKWGGEA
jgi:hypothetical protein